MMKVFHLIDSGGFFGAERVLLTLANEQQQHGYSVTIVSCGNANGEEKPIELACKKNGLKVIVYRGKTIFNLNELIANNPDSVFHSHGYKFNILLTLLSLRYRASVFVATVHGYTNAPVLSKLRLYYQLNKMALKVLHGIAFVSGKSAVDSGIDLNKKNIVIFNGIENNEMDRQQPFPAEIKLDSEFIAGVGRLSAEKAFDNLIVAFQEVAEKNNELQLIIVGDGIELPALKKLAAGHERIHFVGYKENALPYIVNARLLVISSYSEGLPIVLLEAMRGGIDIVSSRVGAIPLVIEHDVTGLLYEAGDIPQLTSAISCALNYKKGTLGAVARDVFLQKFTSEKMFQCYHSWYQSLIR